MGQYSKYKLYQLYCGNNPTDSYYAELIEEESPECGSAIYEYRDSSDETVCANGNLYYKAYRYISTDNGTTWTKTDSWRLGTLIEQGSDECSGECETRYYFNDGTVIEKSATVLNGNQIYVENEAPNKTMSGVTVGSCVTKMNGGYITIYDSHGREYRCGYSAFDYCYYRYHPVESYYVRRLQSSQITSLVIPISVTEIGYNALFHCDSLTEIVYLGSMNQWNNITLNWNWKGWLEQTITIHCTDGDITV